MLQEALHHALRSLALPLAATVDVSDAVTTDLHAK